MEFMFNIYKEGIGSRYLIKRVSSSAYFSVFQYSTIHASPLENNVYELAWPKHRDVLPYLVTFYLENSIYSYRVVVHFTPNCSVQYAFSYIYRIQHVKGTRKVIFLKSPFSRLHLSKTT